MTTPPAAARADATGRIRLAFVAALAIALPALWIRWTEPHLSHGVEAVLFGLAIVGAAFLLSWAAEVAQLDIAAGLALALLALIAVLPEYAVDFVFAWKGGHAVAAYGAACPSGEPGLASPCSLALANMTGANRLLIGIGWSSLVFIAWYRSRRGTDGWRAPRGTRGGAAAPDQRDQAGTDPRGRDRVPRCGDAVLADPAAEALDHAVRRRRADRSVRAVHGAAGARAGRGTASGRAVSLAGNLPRPSAPADRGRDVPVGGAGDRALRGAVRARAGVGRTRLRRIGVLPGAVAGAARVGGAGVHHRGAVRVAAADRHRARRVGELEGEPVDAA